MKDPPEIRRLMFLAVFLVFTFLHAETATGTDPKDVCKEYGLVYPNRFINLCDGDKPKEYGDKKWKINDNAPYNFIKKEWREECNALPTHYWNHGADKCDRLKNNSGEK